MTAFHVVTNWSVTKFRQPDIQKAGVVFSSLFLPVANLIAFGGLLAFITSGVSGFLKFWIDGLSRSVALLLVAVQFGKT